MINSPLPSPISQIMPTSDEIVYSGDASYKLLDEETRTNGISTRTADLEAINNDLFWIASEMPYIWRLISCPTPRKSHLRILEYFLFSRHCYQTVLFVFHTSRVNYIINLY